MTFSCLHDLLERSTFGFESFLRCSIVSSVNFLRKFFGLWRINSQLIESVHIDLQNLLPILQND